MGFLESVRPMFPWEGPPLPLFLGFFWPWAQGQSTTSASSTLSKIFGGAQSQSQPSPPTNAPSEPSYENREEIEFPEGFDPDTFMPKKIVVHRRYKKKVE